MQIHNHVERRFAPVGPNRLTSDHRQKRKGRRLSKKIGARQMRRRVQRNADPVFCKSITRAFGLYGEHPLYQDNWHNRKHYQRQGWATR